MEKNVLGVRIDDISKKEVLEKVSSWTNETAVRGKLIFTPGPEFLVTASKDEEFKKILNTSDLNIPDGFGLHFCGVRNRVAGVDLVYALCELAADKKWTVGLLGGRQDIASKAAKKLLEKNPKLQISFAISDEKADQFLSYYLTDSSITLSYDILKCDLLFVGLGHPLQEKFLNKIKNINLEIKNNSKTEEIKKKKFLDFKVGMGVGGSFDLIAGKKVRAPKIVSSFGFEWLWRASQDPRHFARIWKATGEFFALLLMAKK